MLKSRRSGRQTDIIKVVVAFRRFANARNIKHLQDRLKSSYISYYYESLDDISQVYDSQHTFKKKKKESFVIECF